MDNVRELLGQLCAGGGASAFGKTVLAPIERVKIILQTQSMVKKSYGHSPFRGLFSSINRVVHEQGFSALWRGNLANCVRIVPTYALRFALFDHFRKLVTPKECRSLKDLSLMRQMSAGALSGATTMLVTYPLDLARTRLAADIRSKSEMKGASGRDAATTLRGMVLSTFRAEGIVGLYKGLLVSLVEIAPYLAISLGGYEFLKARVLPNLEGKYKYIGQGWLMLGCGWASGLVASLFCYPLDTVKRQLMLDGAWVQAKKGKEMTVWSTRYNGRIALCIQGLWKQGSSKGFPLAPFYSGCMINALKSSPAAALTFVANDFIKNAIGIS
eukprot:g4095.t1